MAPMLVPVNMPPPPLPEFWRQAPARITTLSASAEDLSIALVKPQSQFKVKGEGGARQSPAIHTHHHGHTTFTAPPERPPLVCRDEDARMRTRTVHRSADVPIVTIERGAGAGYGVPPLAVYHICRICLRPRSARYHREHPIPLNGAPPPPSICRRCRVVSVADGTRAEVVVQSESEEIKLGIRCLVPDDAYVSAAEMKEMRSREMLGRLSGHHYVVRDDEVERTTRKREDRHVQQERDLSYRLVRVRHRSVSPPRSPGRRPTVTSTAQDAIDTSLSTSDFAREPLATAAATSMQVNQTEKPSARPASAKITATASANVDGSQQSSSSQSVSGTAQSLAKIVKHDKSASSSAKAQSCAKAHIESSIGPVESRPTETEIRKIAREEVERYRQAERKMEAHQSAFAHGRMIPVERRISQSTATAEPVPWKRHTEDVDISVAHERVSVLARPEQQHRDASWQDKYEFQTSRLTELETTSVQQAAADEEIAKVGEDESRTQTSRRYDNSRVTLSAQSRSKRDEAIEAPSESSREGYHSTSSSKTKYPRSAPVPEPDVKSHRRTYASSTSKSQKGGQQRLPEEQSGGQATAELQSSVGDKPHDMPGTARRSRALPESEAPSAKLREVLAPWVSEQGQASEPCSNVHSPAWNECNTAKAFQEAHSPDPTRSNGGPHSRAEDRSGGKERHYEAPVAGKLGPSSTYSKTTTDRLYLDEEDSSRHKGNQGAFYEREEEEDQAAPQPQSTSLRVAESARSERTAGSRHEPARMSTKKSERTRIQSPSWQEQQAPANNSLPQPRDIDTEIRRFRSDAARPCSSRTPEAPSGRSSQAAASGYLGEDSEYLYTVRQVTPVDRSLGERDFDEVLNHQYSKTEELVRHWKPKPDTVAPSEIPSQTAQKPVITSRTRNDPGKAKTPSDAAIQKTRNTGITRYTDAWNGAPPSNVGSHPTNVSTKSRNSEVGTDGTRSVHFAKNIEFSPTPPNSDASSAQFRIIGGREGRWRSGQLDGTRRSPERERGAKLMTKYERRGRSRSRQTRNLATDRGPIVYERFELVEQMDYVPHASRKERGRRDSLDSSETANQIPASQIQSSRPLMRALSESPSRERLNEMLYPDRPKITSLSRPRSRGVAGPYRADSPRESRPDSMDVEDGSNAPTWWSRSGEAQGAQGDELW